MLVGFDAAKHDVENLMTKIDLAVPGPDVATKDERIAFLTQILTFTEANIRSYDTKAQIALAGFVLSAHPIFTVINSVCSQSGMRLVLTVLGPMYFATVIGFFWVVWPVGGAPADVIKGLGAKDLFYIRDPLGTEGQSYEARLKSLSVDAELTAEVLKLAHLRSKKARRFNIALGIALCTYLAVLVSTVFVGKCM
jgi:hypothetical protein